MSSLACVWAPQSDRQRGLSARGRDQVPSKYGLRHWAPIAVALLWPCWAQAARVQFQRADSEVSSRQVRARDALDWLHLLKASRYLRNPSNAQKAAEALVDGFLPDKAADVKGKLSSSDSVRAFSSWSMNTGRLHLDLTCMLMNRRQLSVRNFLLQWADALGVENASEDTAFDHLFTLMLLVADSNHFVSNIMPFSARFRGPGAGRNFYLTQARW